MKDEKSCGAVVFIKNKSKIEFLIIQSTRSNFWGFPKGHVELNESEFETAAREILEETGLKVGFIENFREEISYCIGKDIKKTVVLFLAEASSFDISCQLEELKGYAWMAYNEAYNKLKFENLKNVLYKADNFLKNNNI